MERPFVDFYNENGVIPTRQDHVEFRELVKRRIGLHMQLGFPLEMVSGMDVLEFGPGGGFNARTLIHFLPKKYDFVEASTASLSLLKQLKSEQEIDVTIYNEDFNLFQVNHSYDLVLAENCIPGQKNPADSLKRISECVGNNGYLIVTTNSKLGMLSEILRSVLALILRNTLEYDQYWSHITRIMQQHLWNLEAKTRTVSDWVSDTLEYNVHKYKTDFSLLEAMECLGGFTFVGSSPAFFQNFEWYKKDSDLSSRQNQNIKNQYELIHLLFIDHSLFPENIIDIPLTLRDEIIICGEQIFDLSKEALIKNEWNDLTKLIESISLLKSLSKGVLSRLFCTLEEIEQMLISPSIENLTSPKPFFEKWWGRSTLYVCLKNNVCK